MVCVYRLLLTNTLKPGQGRRHHRCDSGRETYYIWSPGWLVGLLWLIVVKLIKLIKPSKTGFNGSKPGVCCYNWGLLNLRLLQIFTLGVGVVSLWPNLTLTYIQYDKTWLLAPACNLNIWMANILRNTEE